MVKLVYTPDLKSDGEIHTGSSPVAGTRMFVVAERISIAEAFCDRENLPYRYILPTSANFRGMMNTLLILVNGVVIPDLIYKHKSVDVRVATV